MRIQNNVMAMNTHRMYTINNANIQKSAEKLSSGYRINRAGDDAAGLAISEKMRAQIRGLGMASKNSQDAISLVQTAEGALQEVHSILQRMNELSVQSATGTNQEIDRGQLAKEFGQLKREINDIAEQTTFNNMKILDGSLSNEGPQRSAQTAGAYVSHGFVAPTTLLDPFDATSVVKTDGTTDPVDSAATIEFSLDMTILATGPSGTKTLTIADVTVDISALTLETEIADAIGEALKGSKILKDATVAGNAAGTFTITAASTGPVEGFSDAFVNYDAKYESTFLELDATKMREGDTLAFKIGDVDVSATWQEGDTVAAFVARLVTYNGATLTENMDYMLKDNTLTIMGQKTSQGAIDASFTPGPVDRADYGTMRIQVGALEGEQLNIEVKSMNSYGLGLDDADLNNQDGAGRAITLTRNAINLVSDQRSLLGAMQNRLEHKISNLDNTAENLQSAESRIRDVDVAKEMTNYTKNNILAQASTSMLAQANAAPQGVLSLLQG